MAKRGITTVVIDVGNTRIKLTLFPSYNLEQAAVLTLSPNAPLAGQVDWPLSYPQVYVIVGLLPENWSKELVSFRVCYISGGDNRFITPCYAVPTSIGPDRWAGLHGALRCVNLPLMVVDCGTALTIDGLTVDKKHLGGTISPGVQLRFNGLHQSTNGRLPLLSANPYPANPLIGFGNDTHTCLENGVWGGIVGEVLWFYRHFSDTTDLNPTVVLTGGDALFLAKALKHYLPPETILYKPNLVAEGAFFLCHNSPL